MLVAKPAAGRWPGPGRRGREQLDGTGHHGREGHFDEPDACCGAQFAATTRLAAILRGRGWPVHG
jgi:hypothetical protein